MLELGILDFGYAITPHVSKKNVVDDLLNFCSNIESIGYKRLWLSEHYNEFSSWGNPELMIGLIAERTKTLKVGAAGILLSYNNSFRTAQNFNFLSSLYPNRIDLGVAKGWVFPEYQALLGDNKYGSFEQAFYKNFERLGEFYASTPNHISNSFLNREVKPEMWILSSSELIYNLGIIYGCNLCISLFHDSSLKKEKYGLLNKYRKDFYQRNSFLPKCAIAIQCICLNDLDDIKDIKESLGIMNKDTFPYFIIGSPNHCFEQFDRLKTLFNSDEIIVAPKYLDHPKCLVIKNKTIINLGSLKFKGTTQ